MKNLSSVQSEYLFTQLMRLSRLSLLLLCPEHELLEHKRFAGLDKDYIVRAIMRNI